MRLFFLIFFQLLTTGTDARRGGTSPPRRLLFLSAQRGGLSPPCCFVSIQHDDEGCEQQFIRVLRISAGGTGVTDG